MTAGPIRGAVAIMQPYFYPYAGYFRLLAVPETFVILDTVQFPRRARVHRCQMPGPNGRPEWLTLPLARHPRDVRILDLTFADSARAAFDLRLSRFTWVTSGRGALADQVRAHLFGPLHSPIDFLEAGLTLVSKALRLPARILRSSNLDIDPSATGQDRILALVGAVGGSIYINAPGGRDLYDPEAFWRRGVKLRFLAPYDGRFGCLLPALMQSDPNELRDDILQTSELQP